MSGEVTVYHGTSFLNGVAAATFDFDGTYGAGVAVLPVTRRISPPACGLVRKIALRTIEATAPADTGANWRVSLYGTTIMDFAPPDRAHFGAQAVHFIHRTPWAVVPDDALLVPDPFPDLEDEGEWAYDLQERTPPGNTARVLRLVVEVSRAVTATLGFSVYVESRVPDFPVEILQQRGGVYPALTIWPPGA